MPSHLSPFVFRPFPDGRWESATPADLLEAVLSIQRTVEDNFWRVETQLEKEESARKTLYGWKCFDWCYEQRLEEANWATKEVFQAFQPIAIANRHNLGMSPMSWAYGQTHALLFQHFGDNESAEKLFAIKRWVKDFCDGKDKSPPPADSADLERWLLRSEWQAPKWLEAWIKKYFGKNPSTWDSLNQASAYEKLTIEGTQRVLDAIAKGFWRRLEGTLENVARTASISSASEQGPRPPVNENQVAKQSPPSEADTSSTTPTDEQEPSKGVREGETVQALYTYLREVRKLYRLKGRTMSQIRKSTSEEMGVLWEWVDRISDTDQKTAFLKVNDWEDGDKFIYLQIATLYKYAPHLRTRRPSWTTLRDWRKAYRGHLRYKTLDGRKPASGRIHP